MSPRRENVLGLAGAVVLLGLCTMVCHVGLATQNSIPGLGGAGGAHFTLRVVVLVNSLVHTATGVIDAMVVVDNSKFFSTLPRLLLRAPFITRCLDRG